jgi:predicted RNA-binding Zn-ribbon protein involved in translation (DUF1610 family)
MKLRMNHYCPHCGSNEIGIYNGDAGNRLCMQCENEYADDEKLVFYVDVDQVRPDPAKCATCVHRRGHLFPWADGPCKDLPFWLMGNGLTSDDTTPDYVGEVQCTAYEEVSDQYCPRCGKNCVGLSTANVHDDYFVCDDCGSAVEFVAYKQEVLDA